MTKNMIDMVTSIKQFDEKYLESNQEKEFWKKKYYDQQ